MTPFKLFTRHFTTPPKTLSDIWEAVAGAVLIDGGWSAVQRVFGSLLAPFIRFFSKYYGKI